MNLSKLIEMQGALDDRIREEKGLQGQDLTANTFVALQVELAEFANEGRWFKHWSNDQEPRTTSACKSCDGAGGWENDAGFHPCEVCWGIGKHGNPLLEEFVDGVHFFLSLAIQKKWEDALWIFEEQLDINELDGDLTGLYLEMTYFLSKSYMENPDEGFNREWQSKFGYPEKQYWFRTAWILFLNIGINGFGFTLEQIEKAYMDKNKINHSRQDNGY